MDFELSSEYVSIKGIARDFLTERWSTEIMRRAIDKPPAHIPADLWSELAEMGWLGIACGEAAGGGGEGVLAAALLAEAAGRTLLPSALVSAIASAIAIERGGDDAVRRELLPAILIGACRPALALEEDNGVWGPANVAMTAHPVEAGFWSLSGRKILVADASAANLILVAARCGDGVALMAVAADAPGLAVTPMRRIDGQDIAEVGFTDVRIPASRVLGLKSAPGVLAQDIYDILTVLAAADLLGVAEAVLEITTAYCKERTQFGRPIGAFQAVSHRLADVLVAVEIGRSLLYAACLALDEKRADAQALAVFADGDAVGFRVFDQFPRKNQICYFFFRRRALGHHFPVKI